jgi:hypothetical protein
MCDRLGDFSRFMQQLEASLRNIITCANTAAVLSGVNDSIAL